MIARQIRQKVIDKLDRGKAIVLVGPRQVGKSTLINSVLSGKEFLFLDADDPTVRALLSNANTEQLRTLIGINKLIFLDEAQRIPGIGITLKIITDQFKDVQLLVCGSSSFDLGNELNEPLTGRKWEYELFPISWQEYEQHVGFLKSEQQLENRLLYGFYPEVINNQGEEREILKHLVNSYLYKDILAFSAIRRPDVLDKLVQALALQIGNEVNYNELSQTVGITKNTIQSYIEILEKSFVVFRLNSFSRNLRNEIKQNRKIYFYDMGVRNAIIGNFSPLDLRVDKGALWENFLITERLKQYRYNDSFARMYFWRTKQQQEIDFIEENNGEIQGFEFKWSAQKISVPSTFKETYNADVKLINRNNFREFVMIKN